MQAAIPLSVLRSALAAISVLPANSNVSVSLRLLPKGSGRARERRAEGYAHGLIAVTLGLDLGPVTVTTSWRATRPPLLGYGWTTVQVAGDWEAGVSTTLAVFDDEDSWEPIDSKLRLLADDSWTRWDPAPWITAALPQQPLNVSLADILERAKRWSCEETNHE